jgi:hypothetical protein
MSGELWPQRLPGQILQLSHLMSEVRVWNWVLVAKVDKRAHRAVAFPCVPQPVSQHLEVVVTLATIILQVSSRQGLSHVSRLKTASCQQSI